jgi:hypothetical protein
MSALLGGSIKFGLSNDMGISWKPLSKHVSPENEAILPNPSIMRSSFSTENELTGK